MKYPLAKQGIFKTIQGEGVLMGEPMVFVRLAGCSVGCPQCDTDYAVDSRISAHDIARRVVEVAGRATWVWVTGGEPTIHDLVPLVLELRKYGFRLALATAGINPVPRGNATACGYQGFDFVSVSPHAINETWIVRCGEQLNVVPGLNGLRLVNMEGIDVSGFANRFVTPHWSETHQRMESVDECAEWVANHSGWRLGYQAHKSWGLA